MIDSKKILAEFWNQFIQSSAVTMQVKGKSEAFGCAVVECDLKSQCVCFFKEKGEWRTGALAGTSFKNCTRWCVDGLHLHLEHLRFGVEKSIFLQTFKVVEKNRLVALVPYQCHLDSYLGSISWNSCEIILRWEVLGPKKNETLLCKYKKS